MKIAYFDNFCGISGNMVLGALIDLGLDIQELEAELKKLKLSGYRIRAERVLRKGISGIKFSADTEKEKVQRNLRDIVYIIEESKLDSDIKELSKKAFSELAKAEAGIHNKDIDQIHFHEIGATDSIIDIIGAFIGIKRLGVASAYSSKVHLGSGFVECRHGRLPLPAPATLELLKGIPVYSSGVEAELVTPTGACILKTVSKGFGPMPQMKIAKIGYGAGEKELLIPNFLRIYLGESTEDVYDRDEIMLVETNLDDVSPEVIGYVFERLLSQGALDVFTTPILMKKNRPAFVLSVLIEPDKLDNALAVLFEETTTFGVRIQRLERRKLFREVISVKTEFGEVEVKIGKAGGRVETIAPEYESCRKIAREKKIPFKTVYYQAKETALKILTRTR